MSSSHRSSKPVILLCWLGALSANLSVGQASHFLSNEGQWPEGILYKGHSATANVSFLQNGISFSQVAPEEEDHEDELVDHHAEPEFHVWNMRFIGTGPGMQVKGMEGRKSVSSFLQGNDPTAWVVHPMEYERLVYEQVYPGIDLQFRQSGLDLKYDHIVHPGGDPTRIRCSYEGIQKLSLNNNGDMVITTALGDHKQRAPYSWQMVDGVKRSVLVEFVLHNDSTFGFNVGHEFDPRYALVIDPLFEMVWASYTRAMGVSNNINYCFANAMDVQGNVYLTGMVDGTFPVTPGAYSGAGNIQPEIFVAKFSADGTTLLYSTYLPGNSSEFGASIAVDELGRAYITGVVDLNITGITDYPSTPNAYQPLHAPGSDAILTVLDPTGSTLVYSTFLGGAGGESGFGITLGPLGIAYITGGTSFQGFPTVAATPYPTGNNGLFVAKFDITQSGAASLIYSVAIGAGDFNSCNSHSIAVDDAGNAYVTGAVAVGFGTSAFPITTGAFSGTYDGGMDNRTAYLLKLGNTLPVTISYATYLGPGTGGSVAVDAQTGEAYVIGSTRTFTFPTTAGALQTVHGQDGLGNPNTDAFVLKMNATGTALEYSTFLGGPIEDQGTGIAVNSAGEVYAAGLSRGDFPVSPGAFQEINAGVFSNDIFVVQLNSTGTGYGCGGSTYVGGSEDEYYGSFYDFLAPGIALRDNGGAQDTLSIAATSHSQDFPTTPGVYEPNKVNGIADQPIFFKLTCASQPMVPVASFNAVPTSTCTLTTVDFEDTSTNGATSWTWSFPGAIPDASTEQDPQDIAYPSPGTFAITLIACNNIGCDTVTGSITIEPIEPIVIDAGDDTTLCAGDSATLTATPGYPSYTWSLNNTTLPDTDGSITVSEPGVYIVLVDTAGCTGADTVQVTLTEIPISLFTYSSGDVCKLGRITFNATSPADSYSWQFGDGVLATGPVSEHLYTAPGTYEVELTVTEGPCTASSTQFVTVTTSSITDLPAGTIPNVFSPNGDGENDCFAPAGLENFADCYILNVYNRWGNAVFTAEKPQDCWRGITDNGEPLPEGVYYYLLEFGEKEYHGAVELLR